MSQPIRIGVIGPARDTRLCPQHFTRMCADLTTYLSCNFGAQPVELVSGGAAWSDHVAVKLFMNGTVKYLRLCLPCEWDATVNQFVDTTPQGGLRRVTRRTNERSWIVNPGKLANQYHHKFSRMCCIDSLGELSLAMMRPECTTSIYGDFHNRNDAIAKTVNILIAFTFATRAEDITGGTGYTWNKCNEIKNFITINNT